MTPKGQFIFDANKPLDLAAILEVALGEEEAEELLKNQENLMKTKVFIDPYSNYCINKNNA